MALHPSSNRGQSHSPLLKVGAVVALVGMVAVGGLAVAQSGVLDGGDGGAGVSDGVRQVPDTADSVTRFDPGALNDSVTAQLYGAVYDSVFAHGNATGGVAESERGSGSESQQGTESESQRGFGSESESEDGFASDGAQTGPDSSGVVAGNEVPRNLSALGERFENETGLDPAAIEEVVVFRNRTTNVTQQYSATIVHANWSADALVGAVRNGTASASSERPTYERTTLLGHTVYRPNGSADRPRFGTGPAWVGVLGDGEYVVGTEAAVRDAIGVQAGTQQALDGDLRDAYGATRSGYLRYAQRYQNVNVTRLNETVGQRTAVNVTAYGEEYNSLYITSGSVYTTGDAVGSETRILTNTTSAARDVESMIQGFISIEAGAIQNETVESELRAVEVRRDNTTVTVSRQTAVEDAERLIDWYASLLGGQSGMGAGSYAGVPASAA